MKVDEWLNFFKKHPQKNLFSVSDLKLLVDEPLPSLAVQLTRLVHARVITRVARGWYANPFYPPSAEEVAMVLRVPSYLSLEYALAKQHVLSQRVYTLTLVTPRSPYMFQSSVGNIEYHQIKKSLFWGYSTEKGILIATPEKAFLDLVYLRSIHSKELTVNGVQSLLGDMDLEVFEKKKLSKYLDRFGKKTKAFVLQLEILC